VTPVKCAQCGAMIDPLALACPYCRFTTPAGVAAHQRAEQERHSQAQWHAQAQYQQQVVANRRLDSASTQSLVWSLVAIVLCCTPMSVVGIVMGARARTIAAQTSAPVPGKATAGLVLGILGTLWSLGFFAWAMIQSQMDEEATGERIATIEKQLGDKASQAELSHDTACDLAEVYTLRNGWAGNRGHSLKDFECVGKLTPTRDRAELEDFQFRYLGSSYRVHACFKRGAKWYVTELRNDACFGTPGGNVDDDDDDEDEDD
jgi:hypothetical protein